MAPGSVTPTPDARGWIVPAGAVVAAVVALRLVALGFDRTDLFVDEAQYWLWGQTPDFGYYSKPPLIAWLIGAVTGISGSDAPFWVRFPAPILHGATALILGGIAARLWGRAAGIWTAATYVTLPVTSVGSWMISTDTVMAPFYAGALAAYLRLTESRAARHALLAGALAGAAFLAKYAAVYFLIGAALAALAVPGFRVGWRNAGLLILSFLAVASPNLVWNASHDLTTVRHTMDNVGWVQESRPLSGFNPAGLAEFLLSQFAVFGPILFGVLIAIIVRAVQPGMEPRLRGLVLVALPPLLAVSAQAFLDKAYANWAAAAYFPGTVAVVAFLLSKAPRLLRISAGVNAALCLVVPVGIVSAPHLHFGRETPVMARWLGRADLSRQIIAAAEAQGARIVASDSRDILADLLYTGRDTGIAFRAIPPERRPRNYYEQTLALSPDEAGPVLVVTGASFTCDSVTLSPAVEFETSGGAYQKKNLAGYVTDAACLAR